MIVSNKFFITTVFVCLHASLAQPTANGIPCGNGQARCFFDRSEWESAVAQVAEISFCADFESFEEDTDFSSPNVVSIPSMSDPTDIVFTIQHEGGSNVANFVNVPPERSASSSLITSHLFLAIEGDTEAGNKVITVSYTHLTLPTKA